jgi:hypothetical protein
MSFLYHLELGGGETLHYHLALLTYGIGEEPLSQEGEQSQTIPNPACLKLPLRDNIPNILIWRLLRGGGLSLVAVSS